MDFNKYTQKSLEAIQNTQNLALEYGNQEIDQIHLLYALLSKEDGLILRLIDKMELNTEGFKFQTEKILSERVKVQGGQQYMSQDLNRTLMQAEKESKQMGDSYVSVEHLFLALLETGNRDLRTLFKNFDITRNRFLKALMEVRGNQRVTSDNPEATYDTLNKYGQDLVERAREQKLDPVIGRDAEIRNVIRILSRKSKNNPVLIGEPGVGKTAIAEALDILETDVNKAWRYWKKVGLVHSEGKGVLVFDAISSPETKPETMGSALALAIVLSLMHSLSSGDL